MRATQEWYEDEDSNSQRCFVGFKRSYEDKKEEKEILANHLLNLKTKIKGCPQPIDCIDLCIVAFEEFTTDNTIPELDLYDLWLDLPEGVKIKGKNEISIHGLFEIFQLQQFWKEVPLYRKDGFIFNTKWLLAHVNGKLDFVLNPEYKTPEKYLTLYERLPDGTEIPYRVTNIFDWDED